MDFAGKYLMKRMSGNRWSFQVEKNRNFVVAVEKTELVMAVLMKKKTPLIVIIPPMGLFSDTKEHLRAALRGLRLKASGNIQLIGFVPKPLL